MKTRIAQGRGRTFSKSGSKFRGVREQCPQTNTVAEIQ